MAVAHSLRGLVGAPLGRRRLLAGIGGALVVGVAGGDGRAEMPATRYLRIATGTTDGTYFPIGGLIANVISNPPGSRPCEKGGSCGVPGLVAVAQATLGTVENLDLLARGGAELAMAQADIAAWAYRGRELYRGQPPFSDLRAIGALYGEAVHIVVRADSPIRAIPDLKGRKVSVDEVGSGTRVDLLMIFQAHGLGEQDFDVRHLRPGAGADALAAGALDAFTILAGAPVPVVSDVARRLPVRLLAITGPQAARLRERERYFVETTIAADTYPGVPAVETLGVGAQLVARAELAADLVFGITRALWEPSTRRIFAKAHPLIRAFDLASAVASVSVPLHPGAERYYREGGVLGAASP